MDGQEPELHGFEDAWDRLRRSCACGELWRPSSSATMKVLPHQFGDAFLVIFDIQVRADYDYEENNLEALFRPWCQTNRTSIVASKVNLRALPVTSKGEVCLRVGRYAVMAGAHNLRALAHFDFRLDAICDGGGENGIYSPETRGNRYAQIVGEYLQECVAPHQCFLRFNTPDYPEPWGLLVDDFGLD